jgi:hypothetical protein
MRGIRRHKFAFCAALSLLLCFGTAAAWAMSYRMHGHLSFRAPTGRYTFHSDSGRLVLCGPPPPASGAAAADEAAAAAVVSRMRNANAGWLAAWVVKADGYHNGIGEGFEWVARSPPSEVHWSKAASYRRPLLRALEDPNRFVIAHAMLDNLERRNVLGVTVARPDNTIEYRHDGLKVILSPDEATTF